MKGKLLHTFEVNLSLLQVLALGPQCDSCGVFRHASSRWPQSPCTCHSFCLDTLALAPSQPSGHSLTIISAQRLPELPPLTLLHQPLHFLTASVIPVLCLFLSVSFTRRSAS